MIQRLEFTHLLALPRLRVQNANAISSPLTHGFPAMTAFLGLMWALERKTYAAGLQHLEFNAVGVISHGWQELTTPGRFKTFRQTRNPIKRDGKVAAIIEEGRIHLDLSLVFALRINDWNESRQAADLQAVAELVAGMRIAGGTVLPASPATFRYRPWWADMRGDVWEENFRKLRARL